MRHTEQPSRALRSSRSTSGIISASLASRRATAAHRGSSPRRTLGLSAWADVSACVGGRQAGRQWAPRHTATQPWTAHSAQPQTAAASSATHPRGTRAAVRAGGPARQHFACQRRGSCNVGAWAARRRRTRAGGCAGREGGIGRERQERSVHTAAELRREHRSGSEHARQAALPPPALPKKPVELVAGRGAAPDGVQAGDERQLALPVDVLQHLLLCLGWRRGGAREGGAGGSWCVWGHGAEGKRPQRARAVQMQG